MRRENGRFRSWSDEEKKAVLFRLPENALAKLKEQARTQKLTPSQVITSLLVNRDIDAATESSISPKLASSTGKKKYSI